MNFSSMHKDMIMHPEKYAQLANISPKYIIESALPYCTEEDLGWVSVYLKEHIGSKTYYFGTHEGVCYFLQDPIQRFSALCGVLIRYFTDARLVTPYQLTMILEQEQDPTVLFLYGLENIDAQIKSQIINFLYRPTIHCVLNVQDKSRMKYLYGEGLYTRILENYQIII